MKLFWTILKYIGYAAGTLTIITTAVLFFDGLRDDITDIKETQVEAKAASDTIMHIVRTYDQRITENKKSITYNAGQVGVLRESYLEYLKHDSLLTIGEFEKYMNPFLEYIKKNSSPDLQSNQILPVGPDYVRRSEQGSMRSSQLPSTLYIEKL